MSITAWKIVEGYNATVEELWIDMTSEYYSGFVERLLSTVYSWVVTHIYTETWAYPDLELESLNSELVNQHSIYITLNEFERYVEQESIKINFELLLKTDPDSQLNEPEIFKDIILSLSEEFENNDSEDENNHDYKWKTTLSNYLEIHGIMWKLSTISPLYKFIEWLIEAEEVTDLEEFVYDLLYEIIEWNWVDLYEDPMHELPPQLKKIISEFRLMVLNVMVQSWFMMPYEDDGVYNNVH